MKYEFEEKDGNLWLHVAYSNDTSDVQQEKLNSFGYPIAKHGHDFAYNKIVKEAKRHFHLPNLNLKALVFEKVSDEPFTYEINKEKKLLTFVKLGLLATLICLLYTYGF